MNDADRAALRRLLSSFDEAGLVALANKGLVRGPKKTCKPAACTTRKPRRRSWSTDPAGR